MPYTQQQLIQFFTAVNQTAPDQATQLSFLGIAQQNANGGLSDAQALDRAIDGLQSLNTTDVAVATYAFFATGTAANPYLGQPGLAFLINNPGTGFNTSFYNGTGTPNGQAASATNIGAGGFNTENRYFNAAINLAANPAGQGFTSFQASYGGLTLAQTVSVAYEQIVGTSTVGAAAAAAGIAAITASIPYFQQVASQRASTFNQDLATKAIIIGYIIEEAQKADVGTLNGSVDQFKASLAAGNAIFGTNILTTYSPGGAGFGTGVGGSGTIGGTQTTFALTTGTDAPAITTGNVQYIGTVDANTPVNSTLNAQDQIRATGSNNTLTVTTVGNVADATGGALISGVDTLNLRATAGAANVNASVLPGVQSINSFLSPGFVNATNVSGEAAAAGATPARPTTTVGIIGDGTIAGGTLQAQYTSGTTANVLLSNGVRTTAATPTQLFIQSGTAGATGNAATVNLTSAGAANALQDLILTNARTLNITANQALTIGTATAGTGTFAGNLTTLSVQGGAAVNLGSVVQSNTLTSVTSTLTGAGLTANFNPATATALTVNTGAGLDNLTFSGNIAATARINTSGGGDTVTVTGTIAAGAGINGGGGSTLATTGATFAAVSGFTTAQRAAITGFSTIGITDALVNGTTYDVNLVGAQNFTTVGVAGGTANLNAASGALVTFTENTGNTLAINTGTLNVSLAGAAAPASTADVLNVAAVNQSVNATLNLTSTGVETINVTGNRAAGAAAATTVTYNIADASARAYTFAGNETFNFTPIAAHTALTSIVSTSTGNANINTTLLTTGTSTANLVVTTGTGVDTINVRDFTRVTAGAGNDLLVVQTATNSGSYSFFQDAAAGDRVQLIGANQTVTAANVQTKITLNATAQFQDFIDAATASAKAIGEVSSFDFGGNTFLVVNNNAANTFQNGGAAGDGLVALVGIHTVGSITAGVVTLGS